MNKLVLIAGGSTLVYACLRLADGCAARDLSCRDAGRSGRRAAHRACRPRAAISTWRMAAAIAIPSRCDRCRQDKVFGRPSAPGDFAYQTPELLGSERTGPDLTNIGVRQPSAYGSTFTCMIRARWCPNRSCRHSLGCSGSSIECRRGWRRAVAQGVRAGRRRRDSHGGRQGAGRVSALAEATAPARDAGSGESDRTTRRPSARHDARRDAGLRRLCGGKLFAGTCAAYHRADGKGVPERSRRSPVIRASTTRIPQAHRDCLHGAHRRQIGGQTYAAEMPPFAGQFPTSSIVDIIGHGGLPSQPRAADPRPPRLPRAGRKPQGNRHDPAAATPAGVTKSAHRPRRHGFAPATGAKLSPIPRRLSWRGRQGVRRHVPAARR